MAGRWSGAYRPAFTCTCGGGASGSEPTGRLKFCRRRWTRPASEPAKRGMAGSTIPAGYLESWGGRLLHLIVLESQSPLRRHGGVFVLRRHARGAGSERLSCGGGGGAAGGGRV